MDNMTYSMSLIGVVEVALRPIRAFKEILIEMDELGMTVNPNHVAVVLETLLEVSEQKLNSMEAALTAEVGRVCFQHATVHHPTAECGAIVGVVVEPLSSETAVIREVVNG
ncbi:hypothetical protein [Solidesulfovibrio alcoholivorans]|uniref:hypothetical protein n=1 Tax=Solidesulfovibrio alcoholivorans TaxID=81406 RepID=UPI000494FD64|nr:hypothetical protein [Solidesulfovibrio alcoholivorans]